MKQIRFAICQFAAVLVFVLLSGCANQPTVVSALGKQAPADTPHGFLMVLTPTQQVNDGRTYYYPYTGYDIYHNGKKIAGILNHDTVHDEQPQMVLLVPGTYKIKADCGEVCTAVIKAGNLTFIDLDTPDKPKSAKKQASKNS